MVGKSYVQGAILNLIMVGRYSALIKDASGSEDTRGVRKFLRHLLLCPLGKRQTLLISPKRTFATHVDNFCFNEFIQKLRKMTPEDSINICSCMHATFQRRTIFIFSFMLFVIAYSNKASLPYKEKIV